MLTRSQLDTFRAQIADACHVPADELAGIAWLLLVELERHRMRAALCCPWCFAPYVDATSPRSHDVTTHGSHDAPRS